MRKWNCSCLYLYCLILSLAFAACKHKKGDTGNNIAYSPGEMKQKQENLIKIYIDEAIAKKGKLDDTTNLQQTGITQLIYKKIDFAAAWSKGGEWLPAGDSLFDFIRNARLCGLFPEDYHFKELYSISTRIYNDSESHRDRKDASLWSKADILLTDAFIQVIKDVKLGRLPQDSITLRKDSVLFDDFFAKQFDFLHNSGSLSALINALEPKIAGYHRLKSGIKKFLDSADNRPFTFLPSQGADRLKFKWALQKRLFEKGLLESDSTLADSSVLVAALKKYQQKMGITADGVAGDVTIRMLNSSDREKFVRIAISMDKYKMLPEQMPSRYLWVNLPGYNLQLWEADSIRFSSRVVCGKPLTRTPELTSAISEMITYPQWTPPVSIILKEILPAVKKNPGYLAKKGFSLLDKKGDEVDPYSVDWSKYTKGIPYRVVQGSGDANALGIFKFNFSNKYAVYLHDTNQRYLFGLPTRALSHGCVRVQEWQQLAYYILRNDAMAGNGQTRIDSMGTWIRHKQKHSIPVRNKLPLFIRYFTCEGKNGQIYFYDDIYGEDRMLQQKYFAGR